jgi:hypothetical protein
MAKQIIAEYRIKVSIDADKLKEHCGGDKKLEAFLLELFSQVTDEGDLYPLGDDLRRRELRVKLNEILSFQVDREKKEATSFEIRN